MRLNVSMEEIFSQLNITIYKIKENMYVMNDSSFKEIGFEKSKYEGLILYVHELTSIPKRADIAKITRKYNSDSKYNPVLVFFKYNEKVSLALSERMDYKQDWREGEKVGKIVILRDIDVENPHRGHLQILQDLAAIRQTTFSELHQQWLGVLNTELLNKNFYRELSNWYFWAVNNVEFPDDVEKDKEIRNSKNMIRMITRIIFIWFIKEKGLVPDNLFDKDDLRLWIKDFEENGNSANYYKAILQNLFFGTLNQKIEDRKFAVDGDITVNHKDYGVKNLYRYASFFTNKPDTEICKLFAGIPFLNGGLFDCLDKEDENNRVQYIDGFSRNKNKQANVPDFLFFGSEKTIDLNNIYDTKGKSYKTKGLFNILNSYKFTITENTPLEEEVALDPELLGKTFENLLASYNPETQTTARKQTGSFYTPRPIVDYMVDESLIAYLKCHCEEPATKQSTSTISISQTTILGTSVVKNSLDFSENDQSETENKLRDLMKGTADNDFLQKNKHTIIKALNNIKILDPACGSGAFPMGILHKMVELLKLLDPDNVEWRKLQENKATESSREAYQNIDDAKEREERLKEINDIFENNSSDYGRKLFLIENCIYGVDIQPIAIQISKLRFFLSLVIEQKVDKTKDNYGIRPLPNLETKFVAANTLIGLNKPKQMTIGDDVIEPLERELKIIRNKYFTATTRYDKITLQKLDKELREKLSKELKTLSFSKETAERIAGFDPYDLNATAEWFNPEWMFSVKDGFDVVIGNPPYVLCQPSNTSENILKHYRGFKVASYKIDLFHLFFEKGIIFLKQGGVLGYITPNTYLTNKYIKPLREFILYNTTINCLVHNDERVFNAASVENSIIILSKYKKNDNEIIILKSMNGLFQIIDMKNQNDWINNPNCVFNIKSDYNLNIQQCVTLGEICKTYFGIQAFDKKSVISDKRLNKHFLEIIDGGDIFPYSYAIPSKYFHYIKSNIKSGGDWDVYKRDRIVIRQIGQIPIVGMCKKNILASNTLYSIYPKTTEFHLNYIFGLLTSNVIKHYWVSHYSDNKQLFPKIKGFQLQMLPIKRISLQEQQPLIALVDIILTINKEDLLLMSKYIKQIDNIVYKLYDLTEEEIRVIEGQS